MRSTSVRDERELQVDLAADRLSYAVLAFGILVVVALRGFLLDESAWDLLALVIVSGAAGVLYRVRAGAVDRRWLGAMAAVAIASAIVAALLVLIR